MFLKHQKSAVHPDLSPQLRDVNTDWVVGTLRSLEFPSDVAAIAFEPVSAILAFGTTGGAIYILGGPGVFSKLSLPEPVPVKFVQFAASLFRLVCVDENNCLHIWDLTAFSRPKLMKSTRYDQINSLTISPSHTHAFLAMQKGEIRTYDLLCLRKSPYVTPNLWSLFDKGSVPTGTVSSSLSKEPVDVVIHPRDLNLVFVAYGGGVILSDLTQRSTVRGYELTLPPGAPGGAGFESPDLTTPHRLSVTALAVHPAGHFFAVGYLDGCIAFWAVEDEDKPILVRTLDDVDVDVVDPSLAEKHTNSAPCEPIFKLSWSGFSNSPDPRGGQTALTVLGGLKAGDAPGLTVLWFPAFNPSEPLATSETQTSLHPIILKAMRESVIPLQTHFYSTPGTTQDFLLMPRKSPHFSGAFDPTAVIILSEAAGNTRMIEAYEFPPPIFTSRTEPKASELPLKPGDGHTNIIDDDLSALLQTTAMSEEPRKLRLPFLLWNGSNGLVGGQLIKLDKEAYSKCISKSSQTSHDLRLKGGVAWADETSVSEIKLAKYQPNRILILHRFDLIVEFLDISAQLLLSDNSKPVDVDFPSIIPDLAIDLFPILSDAAVVKATTPDFVNRARISSVCLAVESLECAVILQSGEIVVYRLGPQQLAAYRESPDKELIMLQHLPGLPDRRYHPYFALIPGRGQVTACRFSDIGFFAAAYADGSLFVVNLRDPSIMSRSEPDAKSKHKHTALQIGHRSVGPDTIDSLTWTVSNLNTIPNLRVRLLAIHKSGMSQIFTLVRGYGATKWTIEGEPISIETVPNPLPQGSFVLDKKTGARWKANGARLALTFQSPDPGEESHCVWVTVGTKGARCCAGINGDRVGKADWSSKAGTVHTVEVVEKGGSHALVAFTDRAEALIYSLPHLEYLCTLLLPYAPDETLSVEETGDFISWSRHPTGGVVIKATYGTLFNIRRAYNPPDIDLASSKPVIPAQPQPVSLGPASLLSSWFRFGSSMTGDQLDALLAGPDRPIPDPPKPSMNPDGSQSDAPGAFESITGAAPGQLYGRLSSALNERGQKLGDLEEQFNALGEGSRNMVAQAKRLAAQSTAKSWFGL